MEESNLINNDNTYNTDMSTSQSTIGGNETTNNKFNKDDLQEVTGGGGGVITPPVVSEDNDIEQQASDNLRPILLILGDGTTTDEEPVLLEEDTTYKAVINSDYESNIPTITLKSNQQSYSNSNYVIAVTKLDKNTPINYDSTNLSVSFTNNENNWCSVIFKSPLEVADQLKLPLNSDNFPDNSKIIVPVIKCTKNTGPERNTIITFNIKNLVISHNIRMNVIQSAAVPGKELTPCLVSLTEYDSDPIFILNSEPLYIKANTNSLSLHGVKESFLYNNIENTNSEKNLIYFAMKDANNSIIDNLDIIKDDKNNDILDVSKYNITTDDNNYKIILSKSHNVYGKLGTASLLNCTFTKIEETSAGTKNIKLYFNDSYLRDITVLTDKIKPTTIITIYVCKLDEFLINNDNTRFALFNTRLPNQIPVNPYESYIQYQEGYQTFVSDYVLMYTEYKNVREGTDIGTLLSTGKLTHLSGHDDLVTQDKYKNLKLANISNTMQIHHFEESGVGTGVLTSMSATIDMNLYVYAKIDSNYCYMSGNIVNFSNTESSNHLGVYKLQIAT